MNTPGFTAEASLSNVGVRYQATIATRSHSGLVQPAASGLIQLNRPIWCLRWSCFHPPNKNPVCVRVLGIWNPFTRSCESIG